DQKKKRAAKRKDRIDKVLDDYDYNDTRDEFIKRIDLNEDDPNTGQILKKSLSENSNEDVSVVEEEPIQYALDAESVIVFEMVLEHRLIW
ncbi:289_t:CDS:2, partial [Racocetra persica]